MRKGSLVIVFIALIAAVAGVAYVVREPAPEVLLAGAFKRLGEAQAVYVKVTAETYAPAALSGGARVPVLIGGAVHVNVPSDALPSGEAAFSMLGTGDDKSADLSIELKARPDGAAFLKFDGLPSGEGELPLAELNGRWYSLRSSDLGPMLFGDGGAGGAGLEPDDAELVWARIRAAIADGDTFVYGGRMPNEVADGVPLRRFTLLLERDNTAKMLKDVRTLALGRQLHRDEEEKILDDLSRRNAGAEVWIDKRSGEFKKVLIESAGSDDADDRRISVIIDFLSYGEPASVEPPAETKPFADVAARLIKRTD